MDVTVFSFVGCAGHRLLLDRLDAAAAATGVAVSIVQVSVETDEDAQRLGFPGSPTIRLNGLDPFAAGEVVPALACRVYATEEGLEASPSVRQLMGALTQ